VVAGSHAEDVAREILRRHWPGWQLEEPGDPVITEAARLMALWGLMDLVASMVDDARDAEAASGQVGGGIGPAPQDAP
jgi:hypothetical protein